MITTQQRHQTFSLVFHICVCIKCFVKKSPAKVYLQSGSIHIIWKTLLPSDRYNQGFVGVDLTRAQTNRSAVSMGTFTVMAATITMNNLMMKNP